MSNALSTGGGHSSLIMYQGPTKYDLDAKECPVGVAFYQPEQFSCACINGIWAFFDNPCQSPIAIIGGENHCFQMPQQPIRLVMNVNNPMHALGESLTIFDEDMEGLRYKVYRPTHINLEGADKFITLNSSWTLNSPDGSKSVCLESKSVMFEGLTKEEIAAFPGLTYCSYDGINKELPFIGSVQKGCNSKKVLEPMECQPVLPTTGEKAVCMSDEVLGSYREVGGGDFEIDPIEANAASVESTVSNSRLNRALESLGRFAREEPTPPPSSTPKPLTPTPPKFPSAYFGEPEWHQRQVAMKGSANTASASWPAPEPWHPEDNEIDVDAIWRDPKTFFTVSAIKTQSEDWNPLMTNHLWMQQRAAIRNVLNITRLVPPDADGSSKTNAGKVKRLLRLHAEIMKKICPIAPQVFLTTVADTFMSVLTKAYRWKEPYLEQTHYLRILTSLTACKNSAEGMTFGAANSSNSSQCNNKDTSFITLQDKDQAGDVSVRLEIPEVFKSDKYEPIIESVWKTFVAVHSYCYKDFSDQYQDHHRYTTVIMGVFASQLNGVWIRNKTVENEYGGVLGNMAELLKNLDSCAMGARMTSEYPYHLNRPTKMSKYQDELLQDASDRPRKKRAASNEEDEQKHVLLRKKRLAANFMNSDRNADNTAFNRRGICLRKYTESRSTIGSHCDGGDKTKL